jgi:Uma2 family endonuclease
MVAQPETGATPMTYAEYLRLEEAGEVKHEFVNGYVYAMSGGSAIHDRITGNIKTILDAHLDDGPCRAYGPNLRVRVSPTIAYYPDALVLCDETFDDRADEVRAPRLIVEVLSKSTESNDRGDKFLDYQTLPSFEEYLLIGSLRRSVERYRRAVEGRWTYQRYADGAQLTLETVGLTCAIAALYYRTSL